VLVMIGANGQLGRAVVERLLKRVPAGQIGVSVRDPEKAQGLKERGVRVRHGDFDDAESLAHAFEGASQVLIVSSDNLGAGEEAVRMQRTAIDMAKRAGASRTNGSNVGSPNRPTAVDCARRPEGVDFAYGVMPGGGHRHGARICAAFIKKPLTK
jgi:NAD(P)H dehydrogenase (quinone)